MFDLFFPTYCINCGRVGSYLCPWCIKKLKNALPECYVCRKVSNKYITHDECNKDGLDRVFVGWEYSNISKKILGQYKYRYAYKISEILSNILIQRLEITGFSKNITPNTLLIPIPIHSSHEKKRGFNQSLLLATHLSKYFKCRMNPNIIKRVGDHKHQSQQSVKDRLSMGKNTFEVIRNLEILGEDIMLIDDVISTGTTLNRACNTLKGNKISAITLFRGKPHYQYLRE
ncbi:TPA: hypothetical protein DEP90_02740 [Patescibacteria group bacterium]|nr:hypothetical protein [Patescibacteria group bacterium]